LEISYIWIDSLCIIQGDAEDWAKESVTMIKVYGGGIINIAASGASDGSQGCFFDRSNTQICQIPILLELLNGETQKIWFDLIPSVHHLDNIRLCPLESRAWTFQERLLSPRTVHFTRGEIFWECHTKLVSESLPFKPNNRSNLNKGPLSANMWSTIVEQYSSRNLSYQTDKLIALAGIAETLQRKTHDEYYAGMFRKKIEERLRWKVESPPGRRISPSVAPTWSWASVDQKCSTYPASTDAGWTGYILDPFSSKANPDYTGFSIKALKIVNSSVSESPFGSMPTVTMWLSCKWLLVGTISGISSIEFRKGILIERHEFSIDCAEDLTPSGDVYVLPFDSEFGLLLRPTGKSRGEYQRIGQYSFNSLKRRSEIDLSEGPLENKSICAQKNAYVSSKKHEFGKHLNVICLV